MPYCQCGQHSVNTERTLVGCTNIAVGQVIAYCKKFKGTIYGNNNINFSRLTTIATTSAATPQDTNQIASFLHEIALNTGSVCRHDNTGAYVENAKLYLEDLGYECNLENGWDLNKISNCLFNSNQKTPVIVTGFALGDDGHTWIIDGVRFLASGREFHQNWGWGDNSDGWAKEALLGVLDHTTYNKRLRKVIYIKSF